MAEDEETIENGKDHKKMKEMDVKPLKETEAGRKKWEDRIITGEKESKDKTIKAGRGMND